MRVGEKVRVRLVDLNPHEGHIDLARVRSDGRLAPPDKNEKQRLRKKGRR